MKCGVTPEVITDLKDNELFVFGSNLRGSHGAGAAYTALQWGAKDGVGEGISGQTYALPTKDHSIRTRHINDIYTSVIDLLMAVKAYPERHFLITKIGCGLAGLRIIDVAPLFRNFLDIENCSLPQEFIDFLTQDSGNGLS